MWHFLMIIRSKRYLFLLIGTTIFLLSWALNQMTTERPQNIINLDIDHKKFVQIDNADEVTIKQLTGIIHSNKLERLIDEVIDLYQKDRLILLIDDNLESHGGFDPDSKTPKVLLNSKTGISESNLAHELIHAVQIKQGYPTVPKMFKDRRNNVLRELCSNIMHIPLTDIMLKSEFSIEEYLRPTLNSISKVLSARDNKAETRMIFLRAHYEATVYLRLHYEAKFLSSKERQYFESLFESKAPIAKALGKELINIINKYDIHSPRGAIIALYECVEFFNNKDLSTYYSDYASNTYSPYIQYWRKKYPFLQAPR